MKISTDAPECIRVFAPDETVQLGPGVSESELTLDSYGRLTEQELLVEGVSEGEVKVTLWFEDSQGSILSKDEIKLTILPTVLVDLEFNGLPEETEPTPNEVNPGGVLGLNNNDNDGESGIDRDRPLNQPALEIPDWDLVELKMSMCNPPYFE